MPGQRLTAARSWRPALFLELNEGWPGRWPVSYAPDAPDSCEGSYPATTYDSREGPEGGSRLETGEACHSCPVEAGMASGPGSTRPECGNGLTPRLQATNTIPTYLIETGSSPPAACGPPFKRLPSLCPSVLLAARCSLLAAGCCRATRRSWPNAPGPGANVAGGAHARRRWPRPRCPALIGRAAAAVVWMVSAMVASQLGCLWLRPPARGEPDR